MGNRFVFCCITLLCVSVAWVRGDTDDVLTKSYLIFGVNEYYYHYSEHFDPITIPHQGNPKSDEYGATSLFHVEGKFYPKSSLWYGGFLFEYGGGIHTYDGSTGDSLGNFFPLKDSKSNTFTRIGIFAGPHFGTNDFMVALHGGLLYYRWFRNGLGSINETYTWLYFPLGIEMFYKASNKISFGFDAEYRAMLRGTMQVGFDYDNLVGIPASAPAVNLGIKDGFLIDFPIRIQIDRYLGVECKTWFEWRPSGISNIVGMTEGPKVTQIFEPESGSYSLGVAFSIVLRKI